MASLVARRPVRAVLWMWLVLPVFGKLVPFAFLALLPFLRDRLRPATPIPGLLGFACLTGLYGAYIMGRTMLAGPVETWNEPLLDLLPLVLAAGLAAWKLRGPVQVNMPLLFQAASCVLIAVLVIALIQRWIEGGYRPDMLMGNVLNLAPLLLIPAVLCTFDQWAPSSLWRWIGLAGFGAGIFTIAEVLQTRGPLLILLGLIALRIAMCLGQADPLAGPWAGRWRQALAIGVVTLVVLLGVALQGAGLSRFLVTAAHAAADPVAPVIQLSDKSSSLRLLMLETGWQAFLDRPIWGHGPQYRFDAAAAYFPPEITKRFTHLHNGFLTHAVAGGLPAVVLFCAMLACPAYIGWPMGGAARQIGVLFTLAFTGTALANNVLFVDITAFCFALSYAAAFIVMAGLPKPLNSGA